MKNWLAVSIGLTAVLASASASADGQCDVRHVDWSHFRFPGYSRPMQNGVDDSTDYAPRSLHTREIVYGDVRGDGGVEAFVPVHTVTGESDAVDVFVFEFTGACPMIYLGRTGGLNARSGAVRGHGYVFFRANPQTWQDERVEVRVAQGHLVEVGAPSAPPSCLAARGPVESKRLETECLHVTTATHPPCSARNPCADIIDHITAMCQSFDAVPAICDKYVRSTRSTAPGGPAAKACDLHQVDWPSFGYPGVTFKDGQGSDGVAGEGTMDCSLGTVAYADLGDGSVDAIAPIDCNPAQSMTSDNVTFYVFAAGPGCGPVLVGSLDGGPNASGKVVGRTYVVDVAYAKPDDPESSWSGLRRTTYRLASGKLVSTTQTVR